MKSEAEFAAWWAASGAQHVDLCAVDGRTVHIVFPGRRGGPAGPDFRDAVIEIAGQRRCGDVELHLRAANWQAHGHSQDPRYDGVVLHVVAQAEPGTLTTTLHSGAVAPVVVVPPLDRAPEVPMARWPCQTTPLPPTAWAPRLARWGTARFQQRVARYGAELGRAGATLATVLAAAVAEALGYGRDPLATRQAVITHTAIPLDRLSAGRVQGLHRLLAPTGPSELAARCCGALLAGGEHEGWARLVRLLAPGGDPIGAPRAAIVVWNAVLPCLAAYGDRCGNRALAALARTVAVGAPGLPSNTITRAMSQWLGMRRAPAGALAQQGLHYLHATWCQRKTCSACPLSYPPAVQDGNAL